MRRHRASSKKNANKPTERTGAEGALDPPRGLLYPPHTFCDPCWETPVLVLILVLLLVAVVLGGFLWVGALFLQGYIYNEPTPGLVWRGPAAGGILTAFLALWCILDYRAAPVGAIELPYDTLTRFSASEVFPAKPVQKFWAVKKGQEVEYVWQKPTQLGAGEYRDTTAAKRPWSRESEGIVEAIVWEEDGKKVRFNLDLPGGKFKEGQLARYVEDGGQRRVLTEEDVRRGQQTRFLWGRFVINILLNVLFLVAWFLCLWLLLRFQWGHALGLAVVLWVVATLAVVPAVLDRVLAAKQPRTTPPAAAYHGSGLRSAGSANGTIFTGTRNV
jgi:hypothetical protein